MSSQAIRLAFAPTLSRCAFFVVVFSVCTTDITFAQQSGAAGKTDGGSARALTADDYAHAERFMTYNTTPLVLHAGVRPRWVSNLWFWYPTTTEKGSEAFLIDGTTRTRATCDLPACKTASRDEMTLARGARNAAPSPDGRRTAFVRDWNLWIRDVTTKKETHLTTDGVKDFGYATDNAGWTRSDRPILVWSPDSKKIATFQQDQRGVGEMTLVDTRAGHPQAQ